LDIIKNAENKENESKIADVINSSIISQEDNFKSKLEAKRAKIRLNKSDMMDRVRLENFNNVKISLILFRILVMMK
jgi:hypothetical protein